MANVSEEYFISLYKRVTFWNEGTLTRTSSVQDVLVSHFEMT